jgi:sugar phosphate permease
MDTSSTVRDEHQKPTRVRFAVLASVCVLAVITYLHRVGFSTASADFKTQLGLNEEQIGYLMATFMLAYGIFEVPWGAFGDRFGVRRPLRIVAIGGSLTTAAVAFASLLPKGSLIVLILLITIRFLFGMFQAGTFPSISRLMADWIPSTERGSAQGLIWMSSRMGGALAPLILIPLFALMGHWTWPLVLLAGLGLIWAVGFYAWFRDDPADMPSVNAAECRLIESSRAGRSSTHGPIPWRSIFESRSAWALCIAYGSLGYSGNFFLTLLPTYLKVHRHLDPDTAKWLQALPFTFGIGACLLGGWISDAILRKTGNRRWCRSIVGALGLSVASLSIFLTTQVADPLSLGILLCLTFAGNDFAMAPAWAAAADVGERNTGTLAGLMNMTASLTGASMSLVTGRLLNSGDKTTPFLIFSLVYFLGVCAWLMVDASRPLNAAKPQALPDSGLAD